MNGELGVDYVDIPRRGNALAKKRNLKILNMMISQHGRVLDTYEGRLYKFVKPNEAGLEKVLETELRGVTT